MTLSETMRGRMNFFAIAALKDDYSKSEIEEWKKHYGVDTDMKQTMDVESYNLEGKKIVLKDIPYTIRDGQKYVNLDDVIKEEKRIENLK